MQGNSSSIAHNELAFRASPLPRRLWRLQLRLNRTEPSRSRRPAGSAWLLTLAVARWKRHNHDDVLRQLLAAPFPGLCVLVHRGRARCGVAQVGWLSRWLARWPYQAPEHQGINPPCGWGRNGRRVAAAGDHTQDDRHHTDGAHHQQRRRHRLPPLVRAHVFATVPPLAKPFRTDLVGCRGSLEPPLPAAARTAFATKLWAIC